MSQEKDMFDSILVVSGSIKIASLTAHNTSAIVVSDHQMLGHR